MIKDQKRQLRQQKILERELISLEDRNKKETEIFNKFLQMEIVQNSQNFGIYYSVKNEVDTIKIIVHLLAIGKNVFLPRMVENDLIFYQIHDLATDLEFFPKFGLYEPLRTLPIGEKDSLDLIVVPLVAFDKNNARLGYGKGFYDRFLKNYHKDIIGLAFVEQIVQDTLPIEEHDVKIKTLIVA